MMKTNAKRKNSAVKKLIPAAGMLALSASMLATSTYAWFTMNKTVTVTGMQMKTTVGSNLLICDTNVESDYTTALTQSVKGILEPVSSVTGQNASFYYTTNALANGDATEDVYSEYDTGATAYGSTDTDYATYLNPFSKAYEVNRTKANTLITDEAGAKGYVDYVFYLKATSDAANQKVVMTNCNLTYNEKAINDSAAPAVDKDNAWRVAVFASTINDGGAGTSSNASGSAQATNPAGATAKAILTRSGAQNHGHTAGTPDTDLAVNATAKSGSTEPFGTVTYNNWDANYIGNLGDTAGATVYYKVTVRVWLEGEDTSCKSSTYAPLNELYKLDAAFKIVNSSDATTETITNIGSV